MKVLVCGGRDFKDSELLETELERTHDKEKITLIIQGGARGADYRALMWARSRNIPVQTYKADWNEHGQAAGPIRNKQMLTEGKPDLVLAFPGGAGTNDMVRQARATKVKLRIIKPRPYTEKPPIKYTGL